MFRTPLDRFITIESAVETREPNTGGVLKTWTTFAQVWASKLDVTGRERFAAQQEVALEQTVFRIRWLAGVTPKMRIQSEGKTYGIEGLAELGRREALDITAVAILP